MRFIIFFVLCMMTLHAQAEDVIVADPAKVDPALPNVLLIGDSISISYTAPVRLQLDGKANVYRIPANSGHSRNVLANLDTWLKGRTYAVIHINVGLHEVKLRGGAVQVPLDEYGKNLPQIFTKLKATGAAIVWATTTPVPDGTGSRVAGSEAPYNSKALEIAKAEGFAVDDLHAVVKDRLANLQLPKNVHFTAAGYDVLGKEVAGAIAAALEKKKT